MQLILIKATQFVNECVKSKCGPLQFPEIHYGSTLQRFPLELLLNILDGYKWHKLIGKGSYSTAHLIEYYNENYK